MTDQITSFEAYQQAYQESVENPDAFWDRQAKTFHWRQAYHTVSNFDYEKIKFEWFVGGKLNITENCLDRYAEEHPDRTALLWEPDNPLNEARFYTYQALLDAVCQCANGLKSMGIEKGDRVIFYMPMIPELAIAVLACARIGAIHSVVFAGFSAKALADRVDDAQAKMIVCADFNQRGNKVIPVKSVVDDAMDLGCNSVEHVLVFPHVGAAIDWSDDTDHWWADVMDAQSTSCPAEEMDSEDPLFILYTSGSTGKPKGVVHTCGGYMVYTAYTFRNIFQYQSGDIYWCTADIGWITGHSYILYGPLLSGATSLMFEGVPTYPDPGRFWSICEKYKVNQFYTAPTAIRALMAKGDEWPAAHDLSSIKVIGSVGEPINSEAWLWYDQHIGHERGAVVDTWWQTETGGIMISSIPGVMKSIPTFAGLPQPGIQPVLVNRAGQELEGEEEGLLCIKYPWPSMARTIWNDHERYKDVYFSSFQGKYFSGDGARRNADGQYRIIGRIDDVLNVSGHRLGTAEIENALNQHEAVVESAVVGYPHAITGQAVYAYVVLEDGNDHVSLTDALRELVANEIGKIARPERVQIVRDLPKTRSGKIMRRILRKIASNEMEYLGDTSTLVNPELVDEIIAQRKN